jgi:hypothetical protein
LVNKRERAATLERIIEEEHSEMQNLDFAGGSALQKYSSQQIEHPSDEITEEPEKSP